MKLLIIFFAIGNVFSQSNHLPFAMSDEVAGFLNHEGDSTAVFYDFLLEDSLTDKTLTFNFCFLTRAVKTGNIVTFTALLDENDSIGRFSTDYLILSPDCYHFFTFFGNELYQPKSIAEINKSLIGKPVELFMNFMATHDRSYLDAFLNMSPKEISLSKGSPKHPDLLLYLEGEKFIVRDGYGKYGFLKYKSASKLEFSQKYTGCRK